MEIKRCPFCNSQAYYNRIKSSHIAYCDTCGAQMERVERSIEEREVIKQEVIQAWNTRSRPNPAEIERLVDELIFKVAEYESCLSDKTMKKQEQAKAALMKAIT